MATCTARMPRVGGGMESARGIPPHIHMMNVGISGQYCDDLLRYAPVVSQADRWMIGVGTLPPKVTDRCSMQVEPLSCPEANLH